MGLIKAGLGALGGTLADQWKEFFYCDSISKDVLVVKGQKRISGRSSNTKGNDNIISNGSGIAVADGQRMIIVDKFGTPNPFMFDVVNKHINMRRTVLVRCNGVYSYKIVDPLLFYTKVCGNVADEYTREEIDGQLKAEFIDALQPAFATLSELELRPSQKMRLTQPLLRHGQRTEVLPLTA